MFLTVNFQMLHKRANFKSIVYIRLLPIFDCDFFCPIVPSQMHGIAIRYVHSFVKHAVFERVVCELGHSLFHSSNFSEFL